MEAIICPKYGSFVRGWILIFVLNRKKKLLLLLAAVTVYRLPIIVSSIPVGRTFFVKIKKKKKEKGGSLTSGKK